MQGWECPKCGKINSPFNEYCECKNIKQFYPNWMTTPPCLSCPNNPKNGGGGLCHCGAKKIKFTKQDMAEMLKSLEEATKEDFKKFDVAKKEK